MLIPLEPIAVGTADCESLSSYVQRLAAAHGSYPGQLVFRVLTWLSLQRRSEVGTWATHLGKLRLGQNINSFGHADFWVDALRRANSRIDLGHLTTRAWDSLFPTRSFQAQRLAWCPFCLAEDDTPFQRLAWVLDAYRCCIKHRRLLQDRCANCSRPIPVIHDRSRVTLCPWCAADLRYASASKHVSSDSFEYWRAIQIGEIIRLSIADDKPPRWTAQEAFKRLSTSLELKSESEFARFTNTSKQTVWYWMKGKARPTLISTLQVYHCFGAQLADHIFSVESRLIPLVHRTTPTVVRTRSERHTRKIDWRRVHRELASESVRPVAEARSLINIASNIGIARRTLRVHQPELCLQISSRWRERRRLEMRARDDSLRLEIAIAIQKLRAVGLRPTQREIEESIGLIGLFNRRFARMVLAEVSRDSWEGGAVQ